MALKLERDLIYSLKVREMSCLWTGFANMNIVKFLVA
jgi:hypothetical protein